MSTMSKLSVIRSDEEVTELYEKAIEAANLPSQLFGMSYEEGVKATIFWLTLDDQDYPLEGDGG